MSTANISDVLTLPDTLEVRDGHSACWLGDASIVLTGGWDSENKCEMFDIEMNEWKPLPDLNEGRINHSSTAFNSKTVYVFYGED